MKGLLEKSVVATVYFLSSTFTFVLNKLIMINMNFKMHYMLILLQSIIIIGIIAIQILFCKTSIGYSNISKWYIASMLLTMMMFTNMKAVFYIPLTLFTLYKNCAIVLVALLEFKFFGKSITWINLLSFALMIVSSMFGNSVDKIEGVGYAWMVANILATSVYVIYLKKLMVVDLSTRTESVFFTNLLSIPILLFMSLLFDPVELISVDLKLAGGILLSAVCAYLTSFSTAWSVRSLSSTSYTMLGALNKLFLSASGFIVFDEAFDYTKLISLLIGIASAAVYSLDSIKAVVPSQQ